MKIPRQVNKFKTPRQITQMKDQFGCVGFLSYGFIQYLDGTVTHVKNPDFNWSQFSR
jgi:hypothetical protein